MDIKLYADWGSIYVGWVWQWTGRWGDAVARYRSLLDRRDPLLVRASRQGLATALAESGDDEEATREAMALLPRRTQPERERRRRGPRGPGDRRSAPGVPCRRSSRTPSADSTPRGAGPGPRRFALSPARRACPSRPGQNERSPRGHPGSSRRHPAHRRQDRRRGVARVVPEARQQRPHVRVGSRLARRMSTPAPRDRTPAPRAASLGPAISLEGRAWSAQRTGMTNASVRGTWSLAPLLSALVLGCGSGGPQYSLPVGSDDGSAGSFVGGDAGSTSLLHAHIEQNQVTVQIVVVSCAERVRRRRSRRERGHPRTVSRGTTDRRTRPGRSARPRTPVTR